MKRISKIFVFLFLLSVIYSAADKQIILKTDHSAFVPVDSTFQLSLLLSNTINLYEKADFYILVENEVKVNRVQIKTSQGVKTIPISREKYPAYFGKSYKCSLGKNEIDLPVTANSNIIIDIQAKGLDKTEIAFALLLFSNNTLIKEYSSLQTGTAEKLPIVAVDFYNPDNTPAKALSISPKEKLTFEIPYRLKKDRLLISFWAKIKPSANCLFNIHYPLSQDTVLNFSFDVKQQLAFKSEMDDYNINNLFVGDRSWNFFTYILDYNKGLVQFYLNGEFSASIRKNLLKKEAINFEVKNNTRRPALLDNFSAVDFGNSLGSLKKNMNYSKLKTDSSSIILFENFDNESLSGLFNDQSAHQSQTRKSFVNSDAPIFSRLPDIRIKSYSSFNEIIWNNIDDESVDYYELEKSVDGSNYKAVYSRISENNPEKDYSFIDEKNELNEIVYYRIRQFNQDKSVIISSVIKVGQAQADFFRLEQNYPNPFNPLTTAAVEVLINSEYAIAVYDLVGNKILELFKGNLEKGIHKFEFDGGSLPSGIYFMEVSSRKSTQAIKMILAK